MGVKVVCQGVAVASWVVLAACAAGDATNGPGFPGNPGPGSTPIMSTGSGDTGEDTSEPSTGSFDSSTGFGESTDTTTSGASGESAPGSTGGAESGDASSGDTGDSGDPGACPNLTLCSAATVIGGVSGDESSPNVTRMGSEPAWLAVQVSEESSSIAGEALSATLTLSTVGTDFDLFAYRGAAGGSSGCGGEEKSSLGVGTAESIHFSWGEGTVANNDDDGAFIAIEIVAKNDVCVAGGGWTLTVIGDS